MTPSFQILFGGALGAGFVFLTRKVLGRRENDGYAIGLVVAALIYVGFAGVWGTRGDLLAELPGVLIFGIVAALGRWHSPWWLAVGWAAHVGWDVVLHPLDTAGHAPAWYPPVCIGFDLLVAAYLASRIRQKA